MPYCTCESADSLLVQWIAAEESVIDETTTREVEGAVVSAMTGGALVVNKWPHEFAVLPDTSVAWIQ